MEDMRDSTTQPQIVKIVRMVVKFHPLLTVTSLIFQVVFLQDWIEEEISNQWKVLKVYCQSIRRAGLDPITEKMKNRSEALRIHLDKEATKGLLRVKLIGKLALFFATFLLLDTEVSSKYDKRGIKTQLLLLIGLDLLIRSKLWSQLGILRERCSCAANLTSNFTSFILALLFAKFYDNSLRSLSAVFCIAIFFLCLLVALRPRTDLGLFNFIIGVIGSITYNRFEFKFPTWIIASGCFVLFSFKSWLDKYWLDFEQDPSTNTTTGNTSVILILSSGAIRIARAIFSTSAVKSPLSDCKVWLVKAISCLLWGVRLHKFYPKDNSLPSSNMKQINCLILTIINVAQGLFAFALTLSPVANYKNWLFAIISYVVFCFWLGRCLSKDLLPPSTNAKGIKGMLLSFQSIATYGIAVLAGLETRLCYKDWLVAVICYVLWWVWLHRSFPKDLLQLTTIEFKALQCWTVVVFTMVSDVISWIKLSRTTHHQQEG